MTDRPTVTVLMGVYNGEQYLREAVESILAQTFADFEFLVISDGSTDGTREILGSSEDQRLRLLHQHSESISVRSGAAQQPFEARARVAAMRRMRRNVAEARWVDQQVLRDALVELAWRFRRHRAHVAWQAVVTLMALFPGDGLGYRLFLRSLPGAQRLKALLAPLRLSPARRVGAEGGGQ